MAGSFIWRLFLRVSERLVEVPPTSGCNIDIQGRFSVFELFIGEVMGRETGRPITKLH